MNFSSTCNDNNRAHEIEICPSVVRPSSVSQLSLIPMRGFLLSFTCPYAQTFFRFSVFLFFFLEKHVSLIWGPVGAKISKGFTSPKSLWIFPNVWIFFSMVLIKVVLALWVSTLCIQGTVGSYFLRSVWGHFVYFRFLNIRPTYGRTTNKDPNSLIELGYSAELKCHMQKWFTFVGGLCLWYIKLFYILGGFTFVEKSGLRLWEVLHLWKNWFTRVGVLRWWAFTFFGITVSSIRLWNC